MRRWSSTYRVRLARHMSNAEWIEQWSDRVYACVHSEHVCNGDQRSNEERKSSFLSMCTLVYECGRIMNYWSNHTMDETNGLEMYVHIIFIREISVCVCMCVCMHVCICVQKKIEKEPIPSSSSSIYSRRGESACSCVCILYSPSPSC